MSGALNFNPSQGRMLLYERHNLLNSISEEFSIEQIKALSRKDALKTSPD